MNFLSNPLVARALWLLPLLLLVIAVALVRAGIEQRETAETGETVQAAVTGLDLRERAEITHGTVALRYPDPASGDTLDRFVELPLAFLKEIEAAYAQDSSLVVPIQVREGTDQIILGAHPRAQWMMTFSFAAMSLFGALGLAWMVAGWNRYLAREGDPADREHTDRETPDPESVA